MSNELSEARMRFLPNQLSADSRSRDDCSLVDCDAEDSVISQLSKSLITPSPCF